MCGFNLTPEIINYVLARPAMKQSPEEASSRLSSQHIRRLLRKRKVQYRNRKIPPIYPNLHSTLTLVFFTSILTSSKLSINPQNVVFIKNDTLNMNHREQ